MEAGDEELRRLVAQALGVLGVKRLVISVHDAMLPAGWGDLGRGAPLSEASLDFFDFCAALGFNAVQLGPQGELSLDNPSPYDGAAFSREPAAIDFARLAVPEGGSLLSQAQLRDLSSGARTEVDRTDHAHAFAASRQALAIAYSRSLSSGGGRQDGAFAAGERDWLVRDCVYSALVQLHGEADPRLWPTSDRDLFATPGYHAAAAALAIERGGNEVDLNVFRQLVGHEQHGLFQAELHRRGLTLFGDLQVGWSPRDTWSHRWLFHPDFVLGAPPSRTTPHGQPWGYPVLDPRLSKRRFAGEDPPGLALVRLRVDKALREYDGLRIDHPHGWVCPWVYAASERLSSEAVNRGNRLFESPDVAELAAFATARAEQLRRELPRYDDRWVSDLEDAQVGEYAELVDEILGCADRAGRPRELLLWELLSTQPYPLERVLRRQHLGRFRVTQKVRLHDPRDAYRSELAQPEDWVMVGNHDTEPIWAVVRRWERGGQLEDRARYLATRLAAEDEAPALAAHLALDPLLVAQAQFADLFAARASNVLVFASDLLGETRSYNLPGVVHPDNWTLRIPRDYRARYAAAVRQREALDLPLALALALRARAPERVDLWRGLAAAAEPTTLPKLGLG